MRFAVPQFIDVEDRLFGPLTLKQAIYLAGGAGFAGVMFLLFGFFFAVLIGGPVLGLAFALAFVKINNRPFVNVLESAAYYVTKNKLYLWKKAAPKQTVTHDAETDIAASKQFVPKLSDSKLKELAWSLDIKESMYAEGEGTLGSTAPKLYGNKS
jgi:hypothetical protein